MVSVVAYGTPAPQGSKKFMGLSKSGKGILAESSKKVKPWRQDVKLAAELVRGGAAPMDGPLKASMIFTVTKPKSAPKRRTTYPMTKPDLSKLIRSTEDALVDAGLILDDSRIVEYGRMAKVYPGEDPSALLSPGVVIFIERIGGDA